MSIELWTNIYLLQRVRWISGWRPDGVTITLFVIVGRWQHQFLSHIQIFKCDHLRPLLWFWPHPLYITIRSAAEVAELWPFLTRGPPGALCAVVLFCLMKRSLTSHFLLLISLPAEQRKQTCLAATRKPTRGDRERRQRQTERDVKAPRQRRLHRCRRWQRTRCHSAVSRRHLNKGLWQSKASIVCRLLNFFTK